MVSNDFWFNYLLNKTNNLKEIVERQLLISIETLKKIHNLDLNRDKWFKLVSNDSWYNYLLNKITNLKEIVERQLIISIETLKKIHNLGLNQDKWFKLVLNDSWYNYLWNKTRNLKCWKDRPRHNLGNFRQSRLAFSLAISIHHWFVRSNQTLGFYLHFPVNSS